jgi:ABC-2 type transport system ATP-binding protein
MILALLIIIGGSPMGKQVAISTRGLTKQFGTITAVYNLDLEIESNETYVLIGSNGAGKTTTVRILNAVMQPTAGEAFVNGINVTEKPTDVKRITGFLPETPGLYGKLTGYEFLEFTGGLYSVPRSTLLPRVEELLELFDLQDRMDDLIETYSTGMRKRVLVASTLIHDPPVIFFDEPTGGLDPTAARMVKDLIKALTEQADKTIFICTHNLDLAEELATTIGILDKGQLMISGTFDHILQTTGGKNLEDAFIKVTGGRIVDEVLLDWRKTKEEEEPKKKRWWRR